MSRRRRQYSRVHARSLVAHVHLDGKLVGGGAVVNISAGGLLVRTAQQLPQGAVVQLDLVRPGMKRPFRLPGCVVGLSGTPPAVRIRFDPGTEGAAARLHALLNELGLRALEEPAAEHEAPPAPRQGLETLPPPAPRHDLGPLPPLAPRRPAAVGPVPRPASPPVLAPVAAVYGPAAPPEWARAQQLQLLALQEALAQARAQLERHEQELGVLRAQLRRAPSA